MDSVHLVELAQGAIPIVMDIAMQLGVERANPVFGRLGAQLCVLTSALEHPSSPDQEATFRRRIAKLLREIENLCTVSSNHGSRIHLLQQADSLSWDLVAQEDS
jgi:hypothetical protein